jgi:hypothetical protein
MQALRADIIYGRHVMEPQQLSETYQKELNADLHLVMQVLENHHTGSVKAVTGALNPVYPVHYKKNPLGGDNPETDVKFTAQVKSHSHTN